MGEFPNKATQWKKGQSGNPAGMKMDPINTKDIIMTILNNEIERLDHFSLTKKQQKIADHMIGGLIAKGLGKEGDIDSIDNKSIDMVLDRIDGKALQKTQEIPPTLEEALEKLEQEDDNA